jgi:[acyl-carrier-protein] S-malonyltransferase
LKKITFLFPGQGSQRIGMGNDIYQEYDIVREMFDMASEITKINLPKLCFNGPIDELTRTVNLQPAISVVNLGFLAILEKESVKPAISAGHSLGEYSALCAAGAISKEDTITLVSKRGELMDRESTKHKGAMHAIVGLSIDNVQELVDEVRADGVVSIANHNAEFQIVITGAPEPVEKVSALSAAQGAKAIPLKVSGAWHSELIKGAEEAFTECLDSVSFDSPQSAVVFNVTGEFETDPDEIKSIMAKQLGSPVRWYDSMRKMMEEDVEVFAEVGPGKVLTGLLKKTLTGDAPTDIHSVNNMKALEMFIKAAT